jgi:hypothetical protein
MRPQMHSPATSRKKTFVAREIRVFLVIRVSREGDLNNVADMLFRSHSTLAGRCAASAKRMIRAACARSRCVKRARYAWREVESMRPRIEDQDHDSNRDERNQKNCDDQHGNAFFGGLSARTDGRLRRFPLSLSGFDQVVPRIQLRHFCPIVRALPSPRIRRTDDPFG